MGRRSNFARRERDFYPTPMEVVLPLSPSVGRVRWTPDSKMTGKDSCYWYLFDKPHSDGVEFVGRTT